MKRIFLSLAIALSMLSVTGCMQKNNSDAQFASSIDAYIRSMTDQSTFSGTVLVARKGTVILRKAYGLANHELNVPNTPMMKFRIGSITKQFTAMAILQLQEKGLLKVTDTLSKFIPDFPGGESITIHQLLTHTSGIFNISKLPDIQERARQQITLEQEVEFIKKNKPEFTPGNHYSYNNSGYILLTYIIQKVSGKTYEQYIQENIFNPLGMKDSGIDDPLKIIKNRVSGYSLDDKKMLQNTAYTDMGWANGAGAIISTIDDMYRWDRALYTPKLVSKKSLDTMMTGYAPMLIKESPQAAYGYGFEVEQKTEFGRRIDHGGKTNGFSAFIARYPDEDIVIIILSNFIFAPVKKMKDTILAILSNRPQQ